MGYDTLPCRHLRPSSTVHLEPSTMMGTREMSGSKQQIEEFAHALLGIEQAFVKTNIDDIGAVLHLLPRHRERRLKIAFLDEFLEFRRTHHVGALTDHRKLPGAIAHILRFSRSNAASGRPSGKRGFTSASVSMIACKCAGVVPATAGYIE